MFTQKISMDCTKEQYERYLKEELLRMGYKEDWIDIDGLNVVVNNFTGTLGKVNNTGRTGKTIEGRTYLGSFNAPLFLALAAMTDKAEGNYREYFTNGIEFIAYSFVYNFTGDFRKATKDEIVSLFSEAKIIQGEYYHCKLINGREWVFISGGPCSGKTRHICAINLNTHLYDESCIVAQEGAIVKIRPATDSEKAILDSKLAKRGKYFDKELLEIRPLSEKSEQFDFTITFDATELNKKRDKVIELLKVIQENDAINLLKSKGYKILKSKTWEEV